MFNQNSIDFILNCTLIRVTVKELCALLYDGNWRYFVGRRDSLTYDMKRRLLKKCCSVMSLNSESVVSRAQQRAILT